MKAMLIDISGVKCHNYELDTCHGDNIIHQDPEVIQCLTGTETCAVVKSNIKDKCEIWSYNCGIDHTSRGCDTGINVPYMVVSSFTEKLKNKSLTHS